MTQWEVSVLRIFLWVDNNPISDYNAA